MTNAPDTRLEELLDALLEEFGSPTPEAVATYSRHHPELRRDLLRLASAWVQIDELPEAAPLTREQEDGIEGRAESLLQNALFERSREGSRLSVGAEAPTLADLAGQSGSAIAAVARTVGLPMQLMRDLDARAFRPESVPQGLLRRLSAALGVGMDRVRDSLSAPGAAQPAMAFLAIPGPLRPEGRDFAQVVRDSDMADDRKALLLAE